MNILAIYSDFTLIEINRQPLGREYIIIYYTAVVFCTVTQGGTDTRQQLRCAEGLANPRLLPYRIPPREQKRR